MPVIKDDEELEILLQAIPPSKQKTAPRLVIGHAVARFNFRDTAGGAFEFSVGDRIALFEDVDELFWFGKNLRTGTEGKFEYLYVQQEISNASEDGSPNASLALESMSAINAREVVRIKKRHQDLFGDNLDPITAFKVTRGLPDTRYWDILHSFSVLFPTTSQWLSLMIFELEAFRKHTSRHWFCLWCPGSFEFSLDGWPVGFETLIREGPDCFAWEPTLKFCRAAVPNIEAIWIGLHAELLQINDLDTYLDLGCAVQEMESLLKMFRSSLDDMEKADDEAKKKIEDHHASSSQTNLLWPAPGAHNRPIDPEAGTARGPIKKWFWRVRLGLHNSLSRFVSALGTTHGVLSTVIILTIIGAVTTAIATWKCTPPESTPTVDSNFWSTLASCSIGTAGLFCTIIPILRRQVIKVNHQKTFYWLLWASLICGITASIVYLYQTRASLVLMFLSSAAQLATTLQIIHGAVDEIDRLMKVVRKA